MTTIIGSNGVIITISSNVQRFKMAIILYEGFNGSTTDSPKLDTTYWSTNNLPAITYGSGRTGNAVRINSFSYSSPPPENPNNLVLGNFGNPLATDNCIGLGCSYEGHAISTLYFDGWNSVGADPLYRNRFMEFRNNEDVVVLTLNLIFTTYLGSFSIGLEVSQNGTPITVYDFRSYTGFSWGISVPGNNYIERFASVSSRIYLELFIDAKNQNRMSVRVSQDGGTIHGTLLNSSNQVYTTITPFSSLKSITWYATHNWHTTTAMAIDDLYFSRGNLESECLLGANTRIYRLSVDSTGTTAQWISNNTNTQHNNLATADGDSNYIYSSINASGDTSIFGLSNLPVSPTNVAITVKPINYVRKTSSDPTQNTKFVNVMTTGTGGPILTLGPEQLVNNNTYMVDSSLITINPATGAPWTISDINNMQIGIRNLGSA